MPQNIEIPVIRAYLVKGLVGAVPLVQHFLDHVFTVSELKAYWSLIRLPAGIALYPEDHPIGLSKRETVRRHQHLEVQRPVDRALL